MQNYFNYFTEVEEHFQRRRGTALLLSTLDWALIETWKDAGIPVEAVLRGIDATFDAYERRPRKTRRINSLAYCSQEVLAAAEDMKEAALGAARATSTDAGVLPQEEVLAFLRRNAQTLRDLAGKSSASAALEDAAGSLQQIATELETGGQDFHLENIERRLTVLEEKLIASMVAAASEAELLEIRGEADREIAPYRSKMGAAQIAQLHKQFVNKRLLERHMLPRLSLFYM